MTSVLKDRDTFVDGNGIWVQLRGPRPLKQRPLLFLDRDGVVIEEVNYLHRIPDVRFIDSVVPNVIAARDLGWGVAIVTNQAGIALGYYGWREFAEVNEHILRWLERHEAPIDMVLATPHSPRGAPPYQHSDHPMRKPNPGMLLAAAKALNGDLGNSIIVGDKVTDLEAGARAGLHRGFHVLTGHGKDHRAASEALSYPSFVVEVVGDAGDPLIGRAIADVSRGLPR